MNLVPPPSPITASSRVDLRFELLSKDQLPATEDLGSAAFGFTERELVPAAHLYVVGRNGGINLGAFVDERLVGFVHAFPGRTTGGDSLHYVTNVCVASDVRGGGIATSLMQATRTEARSRGVNVLKWTTSLMNTRNLYLYLTKCRAELVTVEHLLYEGLLSGHCPTGPHGDEAVILWREPLRVSSERGGRKTNRAETPEIVSTCASDGVPPGLPSSDNLDRLAVHAIELPLDAASLRHDHATRWRSVLTDACLKLTAHGYTGTRVHLDRDAGRAFLCFEHRDRPS